MIEAVADPARAEGGQEIFCRKLPTAHGAGQRAKRAYVGRGPGPALGP